METLNFNQYGSDQYPMPGMLQRKGNVIDFIHNSKVEIGQEVNFPWMNISQMHVTKIIASRKPKGKHSDKKAMWYQVEIE